MKSERIVFDGLINCRDLGGYEGLDNRKIVTGKVFRSDSLDRISESDIKKIASLGIAHVVDLRSPEERRLFPDVIIPGVHYYPFFLQSDKAIFPKSNVLSYDFKDPVLNRNARFLYHLDKDGSSLRGMRKNYREKITDETSRKGIASFFELLGSVPSGAILFHCHDGKDRTGILAMLFLGLLGVKEEDIYEDYLITNRYVQAKKEARKRYFDEVIHLPKNDPMYESLLLLTGVDRSWLKEAMDEVKRRGGYERYLECDVGLSEKTIETIRDKYLK